MNIIKILAGQALLNVLVMAFSIALLSISNTIDAQEVMPNHVHQMDMLSTAPAHQHLHPDQSQFQDQPISDHHSTTATPLPAVADTVVEQNRIPELNVENVVYFAKKPTANSQRHHDVEDNAHQHGNERYSSVIFNAFYSQNTSQHATQQDYLLDGWFGTDQHKAFVQAHVQQQQDHSTEQRLQLGYRAMWSDFWDSTWALGYRNDIRAQGQGQTALVMGVQGLAPYFIDSKVQLWLGEQQLTLLNVDLSREFWLTQRINFATFVDAEYLMRTTVQDERLQGWSHIKAGLQAHYVLHPDVQPYLTLYHLHEQKQESTANDWRYGMGLMLRF